MTDFVAFVLLVVLAARMLASALVIVTLVSWTTPLEIWPLTLETASRGRYLAFIGIGIAVLIVGAVIAGVIRRIPPDYY